jgi:hypothetical protein
MFLKQNIKKISLMIDQKICNYLVSTNHVSNLSIRLIINNNLYSI